MRIALATTRAARGLDEDLVPLEGALRNSNVDVNIVDWDDTSVNWLAFDCVLLRSTWDYTTRLAEFLSWAEAVSARTKLLNPLAVLRWNTDKHYLTDLAAAGVPIVPSTFVEPGQSAVKVIDEFLRAHTATEFVVKPAVGAGARDAQRYARVDRDDAVMHIKLLLDVDRSVLLQPYLDSVDEDGETALIFFAGRFSHAIRKGALLRRGDAPTVGLFAEAHITPRTPSADELHVCEQVLTAIPFDMLLYTRVDLIRDANGAPCVLELELTEPSLFFTQGDGSAERFAAAIISHQLS